MSQLSVPVHDHDHTQGPANAPVTLVEYADFQCPTCGQAYPIVQHLQKHFGNRLRFVFRHFPLEQHRMAEPAAEVSEFADTHGKFWAMHDALFENQKDLSPDLFNELAGDLDLSLKAMNRALSEGEFSERVESDLDSGDESGVQGTPTFFINGRQHTGAFDVQTLTKAIEAAEGT